MLGSGSHNKYITVSFYALLEHLPKWEVLSRRSTDTRKTERNAPKNCRPPLHNAGYAERGTRETHMPRHNLQCTGGSDRRDSRVRQTHPGANFSLRGNGGEGRTPAMKGRFGFLGV